MSIFLPWRIYLSASLLSKEFDINFRNRFAACLACLSSEEEIVQDTFFEFLQTQDNSLNITLPDAKNLVRFEKERYSFFLGSSLVRIDRSKSEIHELMFQYLHTGAMRINKFIYLNNYINHSYFLVFMRFLNLITDDDLRTAVYITKLASGLTEVREEVSLDYIKDLKTRYERKLYSLRSLLPIDVSQYDPIFTVATN